MDLRLKKVQKDPERRSEMCESWTTDNGWQRHRDGGSETRWEKDGARDGRTQPQRRMEFNINYGMLAPPVILVITLPALSL